MQLPILVIPVYQPGPEFPSLVGELARGDYRRIVVVDDGSSQNLEVFARVRQLPGVDLLRHARNLGKGAALKMAFNHVLVNYPDASGLVTCDADGQHRPEDIRRVAETLAANPAALVLGVRKFAGEIPLRSRLGNEATKLVFRALLGRKLEDTQTGLRGIPKKLALELLALSSGRYEFELDMLVFAVQRRFLVREVPIATVYDPGNPTSHFNPILDSLRIYFVFVRFLFSSLATILSDFVFFTLVFWSAKQLFISVLVGRLAGLGVSIFGSKYFVFRSERNISEVLPKFLVLWAALLFISYGLTYGLIERFGWNAYAARVVVDTALFLFNFSVQRNLIFRMIPMRWNLLPRAARIHESRGFPTLQCG